jgi:hypothetical protein
MGAMTSGPDGAGVPPSQADVSEPATAANPAEISSVRRETVPANSVLHRW